MPDDMNGYEGGLGLGLGLALIQDSGGGTNIDVPSDAIVTEDGEPVISEGGTYVAAEGPATPGILEEYSRLGSGSVLTPLPGKLTYTLLSSTLLNDFSSLYYGSWGGSHGFYNAGYPGEIDRHFGFYASSTATLCSWAAEFVAHSISTEVSIELDVWAAWHRFTSATFRQERLRVGLYTAGGVLVGATQGVILTNALVDGVSIPATQWLTRDQLPAASSIRQHMSFSGLPVVGGDAYQIRFSGNGSYGGATTADNRNIGVVVDNITIVGNNE